MKRKRLLLPRSFGTSIGLLIVIVASLVGSLSSEWWDALSKHQGVFWIAVSAFVSGVVLLCLFFDVAVEPSDTSEELHKVRSRIGELQDTLEEKPDFFTTLVNINFKYIDKYYLQTQVQAERSFYLASFAAVVSLGIIIWGVALIYKSKTDWTPAYVATGAGVLSEFVAGVFFYLYNRTVLRMSEYHHKLILTQNISLALKTADSLKEDNRQQVRADIIKELMKDVNQLIVRPAASEEKATVENLTTLVKVMEELFGRGEQKPG